MNKQTTLFTASKLPGKTEYAEAVQLASYLLLLQRQGRITLYSHIPHETFTKSWSAKRKNTNTGVRSGVPDYIIIVKDTVLFLELKREKGGVVSQEQKEWLLHLKNKKTDSTVAKGFEDAKFYIDSFL